MNLLNPTFIVGDLNQDLLVESHGDKLLDLMLDYNFKTSLTEPTHFQNGSSSLIDVVFCNDSNLVLETKVISCPFSNHKFVLAVLNLDSSSSNPNFVSSRVLNDKNLQLIKDDLARTKFDLCDKFDDVNEKWCVIKRIIIDIINKYAPYKRLRLTKRNRLPWVDKELLYYISKRNKLHNILVESKVGLALFFYLLLYY